jgi:hypothetical protein
MNRRIEPKSNMSDIERDMIGFKIGISHEP